MARSHQTRSGRNGKRQTHHTVEVWWRVRGRLRLHGGRTPPLLERAAAGSLADFNRGALPPQPARLVRTHRILEAAPAELRPLARPQRHGSPPLSSLAGTLVEEETPQPARAAKPKCGEEAEARNSGS